LRVRSPKPHPKCLRRTAHFLCAVGVVVDLIERKKNGRKVFR
jgi:hypothetical protein